MQKQNVFFREDFAFQKLWQNLRDPNFKGALWYSNSAVQYWNRKEFPKQPIIIAKEPIFASNLCMYFPKISFLTEEFNKKLRFMVKGGLIRRWAEDTKKNFRQIENEKNPSALSFSDIDR